MPNPLRRRLRRRWLPQVLAVLLVVTQIQAAEQAAAPHKRLLRRRRPVPLPLHRIQRPAAPAPAQAVPQLPVEQSLKILVLAGNGEQNDLERRVMAPLVVQVVDQNERPVEGADVVFRFPISGPSATFAGGKSSVTVRTNGVGQAAAVNWMANGQVGTFQVHVNASYGNQVGETTVSMTNVTRVVEDAKKTKTGKFVVPPMVQDRRDRRGRRRRWPGSILGHSRRWLQVIGFHGYHHPRISRRRSTSVVSMRLAFALYPWTHLRQLPSSATALC